MSVYSIIGGHRLDGVIAAQGAKNSVLPIMAAAIVGGGESVIHNCPKLSDVEASIKILEHLGCKTRREKHTVYVDTSTMDKYDVPDELMREMRSSVIFLGAILARAGEAVLSRPGGCELGPRPIDLHLEALRTLGAHIEQQDGNIICRAEKLVAAPITLSIPSVGATENSILAALGAEGVTVISNAAREPEIEDLQSFLNARGAKVSGAGTSTVVVEGGYVKARSAEHSVIADRIVAATFLSAVAVTGGDVHISGIRPDYISTIADALEHGGCRIDLGEDFVRIRRDGRMRAFPPVITRPYPGFPTDAQPPIMAAAATAEGATVFLENIFENRYRHVSELIRMGADIRTEGKMAIVTGVERLHAAHVMATDLRGGAALTVAALGAEGRSVVSGLEHVDRGYDDLEGSLKALGADISRV